MTCNEQQTMPPGSRIPKLEFHFRPLCLAPFFIPHPPCLGAFVPACLPNDISHLSPPPPFAPAPPPAYTPPVGGTPLPDDSASPRLESPFLDINLLCIGDVVGR